MKVNNYRSALCFAKQNKKEKSQKHTKKIKFRLTFHHILKTISVFLTISKFKAIRMPSRK